MYSINHNAIIEYNQIKFNSNLNHKEKSILLNQVIKSNPYFGFVDIVVCELLFKMFSNNDDFVAQTFYWNGANSYEQYSCELWYLLAKNSITTLDIGAYTGLFSLIAAKSNPKSKIYAFEALDRVYSRLTINKNANQLGNMTCINKAVSDIKSNIEFNVFMGDEILTSGSSIEKKSNFTVNNIKKVESIDIDSFVQEYKLGRIDLVKIDVETAEAKVLSGMRKTLFKDKPDIFMEVFDSVDINIINEIITQNNYNVFLINDTKRTISQMESIYEVNLKRRDKDELNCLITIKTKDQILNN